MKRMVVILLSDKRSGSTLFETELCKHPAISHVSYTPHTYSETHHWLKAACILNMPGKLFYGNKVYDGYGSRIGARQYMIDCIKGNIPDFKEPEDDETLVFEGWEALCRKFAEPVFFEKSPQYPQHWAALDLMLKWMEQTAYDVRFIGLVRNPMAVMYSANNLFSTDPFKRQFGWAHCYRNILAMQALVGNNRFHLVRYEDLIERPRSIFKDVCHYLGLDYVETIGEGVHNHSINNWHDDLTFTLQLHESVIRISEHFGYKRSDLFNPPKPGLSMSEKLARHIEGSIKLARARFHSRVLKPILMIMTRRRSE